MVLKALEKAGFEIDATSAGHPIVRKDGQVITTFSKTASDRRAFKNALAQIKRQTGFEWPPRN
ncbi:type II toxin-antitoxin system HicA family toxin [Prescottella agglutinans]|uniref:type II toxin-antitoxin system HicA family toxin n=1 Tax=Prescottella agglutinans TaxID=1644129 RepID=UPI002476CB2A|nr:type II toxin-antitoxin system HicA family toxin [Prescottella agglutinans]